MTSTVHRTTRWQRHHLDRAANHFGFDLSTRLAKILLHAFDAYFHRIRPMLPFRGEARGEWLFV